MEPPERPKKEKGPFGNQDAFKRMNFLIQAAHLYRKEAPDLSRFYVQSMRSVSEKSLIRMYGPP